MSIDNDEKKYIKIGILTYTVPHRKTYDVLCLLKAKGYHNVSVYAKPFHYVKKFQPLIEHRPKMYFDVDSKIMCNHFDYQYFEISEYEMIQASSETIMLVCGAGIIPASFINQYQVINSHPGYIPKERGLDALKWAIVEKEPVGVTTHFIGDEIDAGQIIDRKKIPIYKNDTFHAVAVRVYECEIAMLVDAIEHVYKKKTTFYVSGGHFIVHKRMPENIDCQLLDLFEEYKELSDCL